MRKVAMMTKRVQKTPFPPVSMKVQSKMTFFLGHFVISNFWHKALGFED